MKKLIILIVFVFLNCSSSLDNLASDSQRNWCYGAANELDVGPTGLVDTDRYRKLLSSFVSAINLDNELNDTVEDYGFLSFKDRLEESTQEALQICKIWADMNEVD